MSEHHYKFNVQMSCGGCSGAVERVLKKLDGIVSPFPFPRLAPPSFQHKCPSSTAVPPLLAPPTSHTELSLKYLGVKSYNVSLDTQTADVTTTDEVSYNTVLEKIKKTGKTVVSGEADGVTMAVAEADQYT